ncbi:MAG TPA: hypothetical protein VGZ02_00535 [Candidatus Baltobacteraceae bacterium]|jgi:hypothetical protein|nr:hypothetical protein [Candidatus Baltobacteraceae bacterium]
MTAEGDYPRKARLTMLNKAWLLAKQLLGIEGGRARLADTVQQSVILNTMTAYADAIQELEHEPPDLAKAFEEFFEYLDSFRALPGVLEWLVEHTPTDWAVITPETRSKLSKIFPVKEKEAKKALSVVMALQGIKKVSDTEALFSFRQSMSQHRENLERCIPLLEQLNSIVSELVNEERRLWSTVGDLPKDTTDKIESAYRRGLQEAAEGKLFGPLSPDDFQRSFE